MKITLVTTALLAALPFASGDRELGLQHYREGRYAEAQAAFARAAEASPDDADLQYNLALAAWRAGDLEAAEVAIEKYASLSDEARVELHRGLLGAVRFAEAESLERQADELVAQGGAPPVAPPANPAEDAPPDPLPLYERAIQKAFQSKNHFVRAVRAAPTPELRRNTERALRKVEELKKKFEELQQQRQQQQPQSQDGQQQDGEQQDGEQQQGEGQQGESQPQEGQPDPSEDPQGEPGGQQSEQSSGERSPGQPSEQEAQRGQESGEPEPQQSPPPQGGNAPEVPEPQAAGEQPPQPPQPGTPEQGEPKEGEEVGRPAGENAEPPPGAEPLPVEPRSDAPGEGREGRELTPEQTQRLIERLRKLEQELQEARARVRRGRKPVERDW